VNAVPVAMAAPHTGSPPSPLLQGVLTETTAELAAALTLAAARRVVEADCSMRAGKYEGWLPGMYGLAPHSLHPTSLAPAPSHNASGACSLGCHPLQHRKQAARKGLKCELVVVGSFPFPLGWGSCLGAGSLGTFSRAKQWASLGRVASAVPTLA